MCRRNTPVMIITFRSHFKALLFTGLTCCGQHSCQACCRYGCLFISFLNNFFKRLDKRNRGSKESQSFLNVVRFHENWGLIFLKKKKKKRTGTLGCPSPGRAAGCAQRQTRAPTSAGLCLAKGTLRGWAGLRWAEVGSHHPCAWVPAFRTSGGTRSDAKPRLRWSLGLQSRRGVPASEQCLQRYK